MKKQTLAIFLVLMVVGLFTVSASAQPFTHSVWTNNNGLVIVDPTSGCNYTGFSGFNMATSWTEPTPGYPAQAHFRGVSKAGAIGCTTYFYDFRLIDSASTDPDYIKGTWDIYRSGVLVCSSCDGVAYGLSSAAGVGNYYKVYIDDPFYGSNAWLYSGYINVRKDF